MRLLQIDIQNNMVKACRLGINASVSLYSSLIWVFFPFVHNLSQIVLAPFTIIIFISMEIITMSKTTPAIEEEEDFTTR